jgi:DNA (cytosine-5)-methyltransferase 1
MPERNRYLQVLNKAWRAHLAPRDPDAPSVISTFAGCGGSSLGYSMAGFRELLAVEWDGEVVETFKLNFPDVPVYHGDICRLSVEECMRLSGLKERGELDVLDGSPPCQGFSLFGKRRISDDRNLLFREYVRLLRGLRPKVFVMENVGGMVVGKMKLMFADILRTLRENHYRVLVRLLNAMYFNVPQNRQRLIFIGVRNDLGMVPSHPRAESRPINLRVAFEGCDNDDPRYLPDWLKSALQPIRARNCSGQLAKRIIAGHKGREAGTWGIKVLNWNRPALTLVKSEIADSGLVHPSCERYISISEAKRIGSFPDQFQMTGDRAEKIKCIGNSVPPLLMRSIAGHVRREILEKVGTVGVLS